MSCMLNIFQRTMLQWNDMHPYNAVHVVKVPQPLEPVRLKDILNAYLEKCGLNNLSIDKERGVYSYEGGFAEHEIKIVHPEEYGFDLLETEVEEQLNRRFDDRGRFCPFRFFAIQDGDTFRLGIVYFHAISGAESIVFLLKDIVDMYMGRNASAFSHPLDLCPRVYRHLIKADPGSIIRWFTTLPSSVAALRRSLRPRYEDIEDGHVGFSLFSLGSSVFNGIAKASKTWNVTFNDIFLAALMKSLSPLASARFHASRRRQVSVGSIVNMRKDLGVDLHRTFGLFLGSFFVTHTLPEEVSVKELAQDIRVQTLEIKKHRLYIRSLLGMVLSRSLLPRFSPTAQKKFYPKYYPLWGGITNINLNTLWRQETLQGDIDYFRAVSTAPTVPLVLSITTIKDVLSIGLSFKTTVYSRHDIERIIAAFSDIMGSVGACT